jgi:hypothetical protein
MNSIVYYYNVNKVASLIMYMYLFMMVFEMDLYT